MNHNKYMLLAIKQAKKAYKNGDIPIGCVIIKNNKIVSKAYNTKEKYHNAINHAEIIAIKKACKKLKTWHLDDCILYSTMEPCIMCSGAIIQCRIKKIVYAVDNKNYGNITNNEIFINNKYNIIKNVLSDEYKKILQKFFKEQRMFHVKH